MRGLSSRSAGSTATTSPAIIRCTRVQFFHRQMNEEVDSLEASAGSPSPISRKRRGRCALSWRASARTKRATRAPIVRRSSGAADTSGQFPVLNFQYRIITARGDLISRLVIQNRSFEAGGLDAIAFGVEEARARAITSWRSFYEAQLADEISHVRFANEWIRDAIKKDPRTILRMGAALAEAGQAFRLVMGVEGTEGVDYPAAVEARLDAGFTEEEVRDAARMAEASRSPPQGARATPAA